MTSRVTRANYACSCPQNVQINLPFLPWMNVYTNIHIREDSSANNPSLTTTARRQDVGLPATLSTYLFPNQPNPSAPWAVHILFVPPVHWYSIDQTLPLMHVNAAHRVKSQLSVVGLNYSADWRASKSCGGATKTLGKKPGKWWQGIKRGRRDSNKILDHCARCKSDSRLRDCGKKIIFTSISKPLAKL